MWSNYGKLDKVWGIRQELGEHTTVLGTLRVKGNRLMTGRTKKWFENKVIFKSFIYKADKKQNCAGFLSATNSIKTHYTI